MLGATGYVGGRLVPLLLEAGYNVRAASRSIRKLQDRPWARQEQYRQQVELAAVDVSDPQSLERAMQDVETAYYLVHSMSPGQKDFADTDRRAAQHMAKAAEAAGVKRIIYLGGLGEDSADLSKHLKSRAEVADILKSGKVPVTVFRAAMIIGSGSASFEILRYLVERLPVMITPKWVSTPSQPIAIRNVLHYLLACLDTSETTGKTFDIGGPEVLPYIELMKIYAEEAALPKRLIIPIPFFTPRLSSYWIHLVTPVSSALARPLAEGLKNPTVCTEQTIRNLIPQSLLTCREAIRLALLRLHEHTVETHWSDAGILPPVEKVYPGDANWAGGAVYCDRRKITIEGKAEEIWPQVVKIGGETGWYYANPLWRLRGILDRLFGGVGHKRGRRSPDVLMAGDALDVWRVLAIAPNQYLKLLAEMKMPGTAILSFELEESGSNQTVLTQTAWFAARGLSGFLYWYAVMPFHNLIFNGMLKGIAANGGKTILAGPVHE